jgi:outer membrane receptor protein involved in Fe transport
VGYRFFHYENTLVGFYGFGANNPLGSSTGEGNWPAGSFPPPSGTNPTTNCFAGPSLPNTPCTDLNGSVSGTGSIPKFNLTYHVTDDAMVYATFSKGFRPGGLNRRLQAPPNPSLATYAPDYLTNYEFGWKTSWLDNHLRYNSAFFWEDWKNFQFSFLGPNSFTIVRNAGAARIKGWENTLEWAPVAGLQLTAAATLLDPKLTQDFCVNTAAATGQPLPLGTAPGDCVLQNAAPAGTQLPSTPKFKGDLRARYTFALTNDLQAHVQAALEYVSTETQALPPAWANLLGNTPAYSLTDVTGGIAKGNFTLELFVNNVFDKEAQLIRYSECPTYSPLSSPTFAGTPTTLGTPLCGLRPHVGVATPRTIGIQFGQKF